MVIFICYSLCYSLHCYYYSLQSRLCHNHLFSDVGNVAVSLHSSGSRSLNSDPECSRLMENVLVNFNHDLHTTSFIFNRFLYGEFVIL